MVPVSWAFGEQLIHLNQLEDPTDWNQHKLVRCKETSCETYRSQPELAKTAGTSMLGNQSVQTNQPGLRQGWISQEPVGTGISEQLAGTSETSRWTQTRSRFGKQSIQIWLSWN